MEVSMLNVLSGSDAVLGTLLYGLFTAGLLDVAYFIVFSLS
jgi:hypothetical protein